MSQTTNDRRHFSVKRPYLLMLSWLVVVFGLFFLVMYMSGRGGNSGTGTGGGRGSGAGPGSGTGLGSGLGSGIGSSKGSGMADAGTDRKKTQASGVSAPPSKAPVPPGSQSPDASPKKTPGAGPGVPGSAERTVPRRRITMINNPKPDERASGSMQGRGSLSAGGGGGGFYGIKVRGDTLFVIDTSSSMSDKTREGASRMEVLKAQLKSAIRSGYMDDLKTRYRIISFASGTALYPRGGMKRFEDGYDRESKGIVSGLNACGMTELHAAVMEVIRMVSQKESNIDTVFLLTDGSPTDSTWDAILKDIRRSIPKKIVINCISIGQHCPEMEQLAKEYKGIYRSIQ